MELTERQLIDAVLATEKPRRRQASGKDEIRPVGKRPARCTCGVCHTCRDNDRWERIFQEKFADPTYYIKRLRRDSTLNLQ
jgi:hypothetical protein